jgi:outer membrane protein OmpA-like peptidoglycan-associated protein
VKTGIDAKRLTAAGWGQDKPIADNKTEEGKAKNRRVEIVKK